MTNIIFKRKTGDPDFDAKLQRIAPAIEWIYQNNQTELIAQMILEFAGLERANDFVRFFDHWRKKCIDRNPKYSPEEIAMILETKYEYLVIMQNPKDSAND